jgi:ComF family protein
MAGRFYDVLWEPLLSVLFPPRCVGCGDFETNLCPSCRASLVEAGAASCPRCGEPGPQALAGGRCGWCIGKELEYSGARAAFRHEGVARRLVSQFKFGGQPVLGRLMAYLAKPAFDSFVDSISPRDRVVVTWVPCHASRRRERGYNQAEVLSRWLAHGMAPLERTSLAKKARVTRNQKTLGRADRQRNLRGVFDLDVAAARRVRPETEAIVLVDDVFTTGATVREVSAVLRKGTALPVYVFTFSRVIAGISERHD